MVLAGKDALFVGEGEWDSWAELRFPSSLLPDVMLKLAVDGPYVLCNFSQRFLGCFKANFANFVCALLILIVTAVLQSCSGNYILSIEDSHCWINRRNLFFISFIIAIV